MRLIVTCVLRVHLLTSAIRLLLVACRAAVGFGSIAAWDGARQLGARQSVDLSAGWYYPARSRPARHSQHSGRPGPCDRRRPPALREPYEAAARRVRQAGGPLRLSRAGGHSIRRRASADAAPPTHAMRRATSRAAATLRVAPAQWPAPSCRGLPTATPGGRTGRRRRGGCTAICRTARCSFFRSWLHQHRLAPAPEPADRQLHRAARPSHPSRHGEPPRRSFRLLSWISQRGAMIVGPLGRPTHAGIARLKEKPHNSYAVYI